MVAFISIKTARDTVFFNEGGLSQLPVAYIWIALASVPAGMLHLAAMKRWGVRRVRTGLLILTAGLFLLFAPFTAGENKLAMMAMFVLVPVVFAAVFAAAWLLAADIFDGARLQSRFGSGFALMVLPSALFGWAGLSVFGSTIQSRFVMKLTESGLKSALHRSVWEQVFLPVGRGSREIAKVLVDGVSARVAEGVGAGLLYFWLWTLQGERLGLASLTWLLLGVLLCWTILTFYMRNHGCSDMEEADYRLRLPDS